jgi:hypothetical protein
VIDSRPTEPRRRSQADGWLMRYLAPAPPECPIKTAVENTSREHGMRRSSQRPVRESQTRPLMPGALSKICSCDDLRLSQGLRELKQHPSDPWSTTDGFAVGELAQLTLR